MKVKELLDYVKKHKVKGNLDLVVHRWDGSKSIFIPLSFACNTEKMAEQGKFVLINAPWENMK